MALASRRLGPAIDEKDQFPNVVICATNPEPWPENIRPYSFSPSIEQHHVRLKSTAFLVFHKGTLIGEQYWLGINKSSVTNSFSMAKSFVATIAGHLCEQGLLDLNLDVGDYLPHLRDDHLPSLTVIHLLSMSSGLAWDESATPWSDNARAYYGSDLATVIYNVRRTHAPGELFEYRSIATQLLAEVICAATGKSVQDWLKDLWPLLGAEHDAHWNLDQTNGRVKAFCCLYATARDFARLGQLYLNGGQWEEQRYFDPDFARLCASPQPLQDPLRNTKNDGYGLHWWLGEYLDRQFYYARGIRGQYIICIPSLELVTVRLGHKRMRVDHSGHPPDLWVWLAAALDHASL